MSSEELGKMLMKLTTEIEAQRQIRHDNNNRLANVLGAMGKSVAEIGDEGRAHLSALSEMGTQVANLRTEVGGVSRRLTELDHILRGVDGQNGLRGEWRAMKLQLRYMELRIVGIAAGLAGAGVWAGKVLF